MKVCSRNTFPIYYLGISNQALPYLGRNFPIYINISFLWQEYEKVCDKIIFWQIENYKLPFKLFRVKYYSLQAFTFVCFFVPTVIFKLLLLLSNLQKKSIIYWYIHSQQAPNMAVLKLYTGHKFIPFYFIILMMKFIDTVRMLRLKKRTIKRFKIIFIIIYLSLWRLIR